MPASFTPTFKNLQSDIERYLKSQNQCEKNEFGQLVFHGYNAALDKFFLLYLQAHAYAPLVAHFRNWNWEWSYNDYLLTLSEHLHQANDWPGLKELWSGVVAKRRTNYNKTRKQHRVDPKKVPASSLEKIKTLLLDALDRLKSYAASLHQIHDIDESLEMIHRVEQSKQA